MIDFNPQVYQTLTAKGVQVTYGDISNPDTLAHSGIAHAEIVISTVPDYLLKGTSNEKLVRKVRAQNATAKIIAVADVLEDVQRLYAAGADYVLSSRLVEAKELLAVIDAAENELAGRPARGARRRHRQARGSAAVRLERLHALHARHRLDRAGDLRRDLEAAGQLHLDLGVARPASAPC